jgi:redox-sensitive bicupin YhaK (pirin superfamily)
VHFLQIWIQPNVAGIPASYEEKHFAPDTKQGKLRLVASSDGRDGSVLIHQDAALYAAILDGGQALEHPLAPGRNGYVHVVRGQVTVNGMPLGGGDALKLSSEATITLAEGRDAEVLVFDLPY